MNIYRHIRDKQTLEREYSPSSCVADLGPLLREYSEKSAAARAQLGEPAVHRYGTSDAELLDFFPARTARQRAGVRPAVVYIHGGYWQELSKDEHSFAAVACNRHDINYIAVNYGLAPAATLDELVARCRRAIAWIVRHCADLGIDASAIHVSGCSAGAQLAAMTGLTAWAKEGFDTNPIRSLTLLSGVYDLTPLPLTYINDAVRMSVADALRNSPALLIDAAVVDFPPALIVYGDNEPAEFKRQSSEFAQAILRKGGAAALYEIEGRNHFDLVFDIVDERTRFGRLMLEHIGVAH